jgi:hypothetical protein
LPDDYEQCFADMFALLQKIEISWWVDVLILTMQLLMEVALGEGERPKSWLEASRKHLRTHWPTPDPNSARTGAHMDRVGQQ